MKKAFREYHVFDEDDMNAIWTKALVVIDTNVILDFNDIAKQYEDSVKAVKKRVETLCKRHPDHIERDEIVKRLEEVYTDDIVGPEFEDRQLEELVKEGDERYSKNIPPGYKDCKKEDGSYRPVQRKYGDLAIWKQIIKKAEEVKNL